MGCRGFAIVDNGGEPPFGNNLSGDKQSGPNRGERVQPESHLGVVKDACAKCAMPGVAPHDLRRTCARLCHEAGGELEQIQFLLGHVSVETTERYLGCKQRVRNAVNDRIGIEPD
jgi:integrase